MANYNKERRWINKKLPSGGFFLSHTHRVLSQNELYKPGFP